VSVTSTTVETRLVRPRAGCGTLESPWTGWEDQVECAPGRDAPGILVFPAGFWSVPRPLRLGSGVLLTVADETEGRAWFLPAVNAPVLDSLFRVDGSHDIRLRDICLNGSGGRARHGLVVRCGTRIQVTGCRFGDFRAPDGGAILLSGESEDRPVLELVIQGCRFRNGSAGIRLERDLSDLLVEGNRFEEITGPALRLDPKDRWADYGLIAVRNRIIRNNGTHEGPFLAILPGAEGIRLADNSLEAPAEPTGDSCAGIEIRGGGPMSRRRLEVVNNRMVGVPGPALSARHCGPGFLAAGNHVESCGAAEQASVRLEACHGVVVEDNEIKDPRGDGLVAVDCSRSRINGNDVEGAGDSLSPRGGTCGVLVEGDGSRRLSVTDNRVLGMRHAGLRIASGAGVRVVGNEIQDCGVGIRVEHAERLLLVGNDCRDNGEGGIVVEEGVARGFVALNYAILNGPVDLDVRGERIRSRGNKVDREAGKAAS
jgi:hypothetical protein